MHWQKQFWTAAQTTYMYINIDRKMKLVHILYKNPGKGKSCDLCQMFRWAYMMKLLQIISNKLSASSRLWFDTWKKCAKKIRGGGEGLSPPLTASGCDQSCQKFLMSCLFPFNNFSKMWVLGLLCGFRPILQGSNDDSIKKVIRED